MTIITLITLFATLTTTSGQPSDLCDIVYNSVSNVFCQPNAGQRLREL